MDSSRAYWYIPNHVIFVHNVGDLTADHFRSVDQEIIALIDEAKANGIAKTNVLVDCTEMTKLPPLLDLEGGKILKYLGKPNCGWTMIVGYSQNPFLVVLSRLLTSIMHSQLLLSPDLIRAMRQIARLEPEFGNLPDIEAWKQQTVIRIETD